MADITASFDIADNNFLETLVAISTPMLVTFCVYIFGMILLGLSPGDQRKTSTTIFWAVVSWAIRDGIIGGCVGYERLAVMGLPGAVFLSGISESWIAIA